MTTIEQIIFYKPDDTTFYGDRVRTEFHVDGHCKKRYTGEYGDTLVDAVFYGYVKAAKEFLGDDEVEVKFSKVCCLDWDDVDDEFGLDYDDED